MRGCFSKIFNAPVLVIPSRITLVPTSHNLFIKRNEAKLTSYNSMIKDGLRTTFFFLLKTPYFKFVL